MAADVFDWRSDDAIQAYVYRTRAEGLNNSAAAKQFKERVGAPSQVDAPQPMFQSPWANTDAQRDPGPVRAQGDGTVKGSLGATWMNQVIDGEENPTIFNPDSALGKKWRNKGGGGGGNDSSTTSSPADTSAPTRDTAPPKGSPDAKASGTQTSPSSKALTLGEVEAWLGGKMANNFQGTGVPLTENGERQQGVKTSGNMTVISPSDPIAAKAFGEDWVEKWSKNPTNPENPQAGNSPAADTVDQTRAVAMEQDEPVQKAAVKGFNGAVFGGGDDESSPGLAGTISSEERARRDAFLSGGDSMSALKGLDRHLGRTRLNGQTYSIGPEGKLIETTRDEDWQLRHGGKNMSADREGFATLVRERLAKADTPEDKAETLKSTYLTDNPGVKEGTPAPMADPSLKTTNIHSSAVPNSERMGNVGDAPAEDTMDGADSVIPASNMNQRTMITPDSAVAVQAFGQDWVDAAKKRTSFRDHNATINR